MKVLIVRHAPAGDRESFARTGKLDSLRPLSAEGRTKMRRAAKGLKKIVNRIDLIATSPFTRAKQTAAILQNEFKEANAVQLRELTPEAQPENIAAWLRAHREETIALVGHEPHLGKLIAYLCTGDKGIFTELKKEQACLLEFGATPKKDTAKMLWSLMPSQLRLLRK